MTDPLPENAENYNIAARRRRRKKWFRLFTPPETLEGFYSPFLPLLILFLAFIVLLVYEISSLRYRKIALFKQNARLIQVMQKADEQTQYIEGLHKDLQTLAPAHPAAALLLREFFPDTPPATNADGSPKTPQK
jgi:hypothetical protein